MRTLYVLKGETLNIRIIESDDEPKNVKTWRNQARPGNVIITIEKHNHISYIDPAMTIEEKTVFGKTVQYR